MKRQTRKKDVYAFIDSQNLNLAIRSMGWKLDFARFKIYLEDKYDVTKAFLFIGYVKKNENLYRFLKNAGFELVFKPTIRDGDGKIKGNVDAELVLHATSIEYGNYDKAIIVSGDGDFRCLIKFLKERNKLLKVLIPNMRFYSQLLIPFKKFITFMNDLKDKLEFKQKNV